MVIDQGFFVENYVGEYTIEYNEELDAKFIVSKEFNHAAGEERALPKKRIFDFDRGINDCLFMELANVDISSDKSILKYCNKYGLPISSQICSDEESGLDKDVDAAAVKLISERISGYYSRQDTMDRLEFCKLAVEIRGLMELKSIVNQHNIGQNLRFKLISLLTYFIFFSHEDLYEYEQGEQLPSTRIMNLQYQYHFFCKCNRNKLQFASPADRLSTFLSSYKYLIDHKQLIQNPMTLSDLESEENLRVLRCFERVFLGDNCSTIIVNRDIIGDSRALSLKIVPGIVHTKNQFSLDEFGRVTFDNEVKYEGNMDEDLRKLAIDVLRDAINEGLTQITPRLCFDNRGFRGEWQLKYQIEGLFMEFFIEIARDSQYRICANPTCGKYFSVSKSRSDKKYCCHECAVLQAKRNERARKKAKKNSQGNPVMDRTDSP